MFDVATLGKRAGMALIGLAVQEGPALLAWGDWSDFSRQPARRASFVFSALSALVVALKGVNFSTGQREMLHQRVAAALIFGWILGGKAASGLSDRRGVFVLPDGPVRWLGLLVAIGSAVTFEWSRTALGRHYSIMAAVQPDHKLITTGPYHWVRHPGYSSLIGYHLGYALIFRSLLGLASTIPLALAVLWRVEDEEKLLESEFGTEYRDYSQQTPRLIPGIY